MSVPLKKIASNASSLHRRVGEVLSEKPFCLHKIFTEYQVKLIDKNYHNPKTRFDWVILDIKVVIECHGDQHYREVIGWTQSKTHEEAAADLEARQKRDLQKKQVAISNGFTYIELTSKEIHGNLSVHYLLKKISEARKEQGFSVEKEEEVEVPSRAQKQRRQRYLESKERYKKNKALRTTND